MIGSLIIMFILFYFLTGLIKNCLEIYMITKMIVKIKKESKHKCKCLKENK